MEVKFRDFVILLLEFAYLYLLFQFFPNKTYYYLIYLIIPLIYSSYLYIRSKIKNKKNINNVVDFKYYRDYKFKKISPFVAGVLTNKCDFGINTILIVIYDLIDKNIIDRVYNNDEVYIKLSSKVSLEDINKLEIEIQRLIKCIFSSSNDSNLYLLNDIIMKFRTDINFIAIKDSIIDYYKRDVMKFYDSSINSFGREINIFIYFLILIPVPLSIVFAFVELLSVLPDYTFILSIIILAILNYKLYFLNKKKYILKSEYVEEVNKLNGLYNFLNDFSNMDDKKLKYVEIYDDYYLYALSFGLTDKVNSEIISRDNMYTDLYKHMKYFNYNK